MIIVLNPKSISSSGYITIKLQINIYMIFKMTKLNVDDRHCAIFLCVRDAV